MANTYILHYIDVWFSHTSDFGRDVPIFIIGAPRSGSTLLMQIIANTYDVGYMTNVHDRYFGSPAICENFLKSKSQSQHGNYQSNFGAVEGDRSPAESGNYWYRFFKRKPAYAALADISNGKLRALRKSLLHFSYAAKKPIVFKNMYVALRLEPLVKAVPEALFVVIKRDEFDNAHSLLEARYKMHGSYEHWWSMEPKNIEALRTLSPGGQVVNQIREIYSHIDDELQKADFNANKYICINYEDLCCDTHRALRRLEDFFEANGVRINKKSMPPKVFERRTDIRLPEYLVDDVQQSINGKR